MNSVKQAKYLAKTSGGEMVDPQSFSKTARNPPQMEQKANSSNKIAYLIRKNTKTSAPDGGSGSPALLFMSNL